MPVGLTRPIRWESTKLLMAGSAVMMSATDCPVTVHDDVFLLRSSALRHDAHGGRSFSTFLPASDRYVSSRGPRVGGLQRDVRRVGGLELGRGRDRSPALAVAIEPDRRRRGDGAMK